MQVKSSIASHEISRRRFLSLATKASLVGLGAFVLSKIPAQASTVFSSGGQTESLRGTWRIELLKDYPYPPSVKRYSKKARFISAEQALEKFRSRKWPVNIVNSAV